MNLDTLAELKEKIFQENSQLIQSKIYDKNIKRIIQNELKLMDKDAEPKLIKQILATAYIKEHKNGIISMITNIETSLELIETV